MSFEKLLAGMRKFPRTVRSCGREIIYYTGIALALIALALVAERYRHAGSAKPEPASLPAVEFSEGDAQGAARKEAAAALPGGAELLRAYSNTPAWNAALGLWESHPAVDYRLPGDAVTCILPGTVRAVHRGGALGGCVELDCGESIFRYASIEPREDLMIGDALEAGETIGTASGNLPGESDLGPHLHLEIIEGGASVDFAEWSNRALAPDGD